MSQDDGGSWAYSTGSPMEGDPAYEYASGGYGYYGTPGESSSEAAAGYVEKFLNVSVAPTTKLPG